MADGNTASAVEEMLSRVRALGFYASVVKKVIG